MQKRVHGASGVKVTRPVCGFVIYYIIKFSSIFFSLLSVILCNRVFCRFSIFQFYTSFYDYYILHWSSFENGLYSRGLFRGEEGASKQGRVQEVPLTTHVARHSTEHCRTAEGKREREREREREQPVQCCDPSTAALPRWHLVRVSNVFVGVGEHVQDRWFASVSSARIHWRDWDSLRMTRSPNHPDKVSNACFV